MGCDKLNNKEKAELNCLERKLEKDRKLSQAAAERLKELRRRARTNGQK